MPKITYHQTSQPDLGDIVLRSGSLSGFGLTISNIPADYRDLELHILNPLVSSDNTHNGIK